MSKREYGFRTRALHAGANPDPSTGSMAVPIYQSTSFVFENTDHAADLFALKEFGNIYTRIGNPTNAALEERIASLEGGVGGVATASGQAAELLAITTIVESGDHIVSSSSLYGGTFSLFDVTLRKFGIQTTFTDSDEPDAFASSIKPNTKLLYTEIVGNPSGAIADIERLADVAHSHDIPLVVDNTFATPYLCRPFEYGADIIVHSATKFIGGHGNSIGGLVVDGGRFPWDNGRYPGLTEPIPSYNNLRFYETFAGNAFSVKLRVEQLRDLGACLSPFNAFLLLQGIETLPQRMDNHVANAQAVAEWLESQAQVSWVNYAGLNSSPNHNLAKKYMPKGPGAIFTFGLEGGRERGARFINSLEMISHLANVGDAKTLIIHPASTTHSQLSETDLIKSGITPDTIRISVGLEDLEDILWDLEQAL